MATIKNVTALRNTLLSRGYTPLVNRDKRCLLKGWPTVEVTEALITERWSRMHKDKATGLRVENNLGFLDNDISIEAINKAVVDRWAQHLPHIFDDADVPLLERGTTASCKVAFFLRLSETFGRLATHDFVDDQGGVHKVEMWGGASPRQAGAFGAHNVDKGTEYVWPHDSPLDVDLKALPSLNKGQCAQLIEIAERVMAEKGLRQVERLDDDDDRDTVYDIVPTMEFESGDSVYTLDELKALLATIDSLRLTGAWHDQTSDNRDNPRCIARLLDSGALLITDFGEDGRKHMEASQAEEIGQADIDAAFAALNSMGETEADLPPQKGDNAATAAARLRRQWVFCPDSKTPVINIRDPGWRLPQNNFVTMMAPFVEIRYGPMGGEKPVNPAKLWLCDHERITVKGVQMRPDKPRPTFEEDGHAWLNSYRPPVHAGAGDSTQLWALIEQLAPDDFERRWFTQNLAYKFLHPEIPGPAVIMLAQDQFGTGRGTFMELLGKLFGPYVTQLPAHLFTGSSYQSQYTEWLADNVIVCVEEMVELRGNSKWSAKHDIYERMKELIEPRLKRRKIVRRGTKATDEWVSCSLYAFLNDLDIPIHERDRRCFVLRNGGPRETAFWVAVNAALNNPADVAAFARDLAAVDLTGYSPYDPPPETEAKLAMADNAKPDIQIGLETVLAQLQSTGAQLFSMLHVVNGMRAVKHSDSLGYPDQWESWIGKLVAKQCFRVGVRNGQNWLPMFEGKRWATYAWTTALAARWTKVDSHFVEHELWKAGPLKSSHIGSGFAGWSGSSPFGTPDDQKSGDGPEDGDSGGDDGDSS